MRTDRQFMLGIIGCGHMGKAIAKGAVSSAYLERYRICVYDPDPAVKDLCQTEGFTCLESGRQVAESSHITLLSVKPQESAEVLTGLKGADIHVLLSIMTGVSISHIQEILGADLPIIRAMPNTPLLIKEGATVLCKSDACKADDYDFVFQLFSSMGVTRTVTEPQINASVAVHGSTPAYFYYFAQCLINDAVSRGMDEETARALIVQTMIGSGGMLENYPQRPISVFLEEVCSKGGTTIEAINKFKEEDLAKTVNEANEACINRAEKLGK